MRAATTGLLLPRLAIVAVLLCGLLGAWVIGSPAAADGTGCTTASPASGAYTVSLCMTAPAEGATLTGPSAVTATLTVTGTTPPTPGGKLFFFLDGEYILTDYQAPYAFTLPTERWVDGAHLLEVEALMKDSFLVTPRAALHLTFANGVTTPPVNTNSFVPTTGATPPPGQSFVVAAAGDGAGGETNAASVSDVIASWNPSVMLYLGDVYEKGTPTEYYNWYGTGTNFYSRFRGVTNPTIGNHEYEGGSAPGYFDYWNNVPHYYSYNAGGWHFISLDSNSQFGQATPGTPQYDWLAADLAANTAACTVAYWHHPVHNVGPEGDAENMLAIWALLAQNGVDLILNGHDHNYQRWQALDHNGTPSAGGVTQIIAGAGGHGVQGAVRTDTRVLSVLDSPLNAFGALRLELNASGAAYRYVNTHGAVLDSGSLTCSGAPVDTIAPSVPMNLAASSNSSTKVDLTWTASTDNVGVTGYDIYRNGALLATSGPSPLYGDTAVTPGSNYTYEVRARDAAGNVSGPSNPASIVHGSVLFVDGFESGTLAPNWAAGLVAGSPVPVVVQSQEVNAGAYALRATGNNSPSFAFHDVATPAGELYAGVWFKIVSQSNASGNNVSLLKFRDNSATKAGVSSVFVSNTGRLGVRNDSAGTSATSTTTVTTGTWHSLQARTVTGSQGLIEVWLDGVKVTTATLTGNFGNASIGRMWLGENTAKTFDVAFDDFALNATLMTMTDTVVPGAPTGLATTTNTALAFNFGWTAAIDNVGVTGYAVYRNGSPIATIGAVTSFSDTTVNPGVSYTYRLLASDAAGNQSALSAPLTITTPSDATPPTVSLTAPGPGAVISGTIVIAADASDDSALAHVEFLVNGVVVGETDEPPYSLLWDSAGILDGPATIQARAEDLSHNETTSAPVAVVIDNVAPDTLITAGPTGTTNLTTATFSFSASEPGATFACALDAGTFAPCTSPRAYSGLTNGPHTFRVVATDAAGNADTTEATRTWTVDTNVAPLFSDGFESGSLAGWTNQGAGLAVESTAVLEGGFAARAASAGATTSWAYASLPTPQNDVYYRAWFRIESQGPNNVSLLRFRTSGGAALLGVFVSSTGKLGWVNDATAGSVTSTVGVSAGAWHEVQARAFVNGGASQVDVWLDGVAVPELSATTDLGSTAIGRLQLGDSTPSRVYSVLFDEVLASAGYVAPTAAPHTVIESGPTGVVPSSTATFTFSASAPGATFACALDGAPFAACTSPATYPGLTEGSHTFQVRAAAGGDEDLTAATRTWTVDATAPTAVLAPANGATGVAVNADVTALFSKDMNASSFGSAGFTLVEQSTATGVGATISYDAPSKTATLHPTAPLLGNTTYVATVKTGVGGPTDLAGNGLAADVTASFTTAAADLTPPSAPAGLGATAVNSGTIDLTWSASTDDVGVVAYDVYRNGTLIGSGVATSYSDKGVAPASAYVYTVKARDAEGNVSDASAPAGATTPAALLSDRFESGVLAPKWNNQGLGLAIQQQQVFAGAFAARATSADGAAHWAYAQLGAPQTNLYSSVRFNLVSHSTNVSLIRVRTGANAAVATIFVSATGKLGYTNDAGSGSVTSNTSVTGGWRTLQAHVVVNGGAGQLEVWLDGVKVRELDLAGLNFGATPIERLQLGESATGRFYDVAFDDVVAANAYINAGELEVPTAPAPASATPAGATQIDLAWAASTDNVGVTGYNVYRDGALLVSLGAVTTHSDTTVLPATTYQYEVRARDAAENLSTPASASATTPNDPNGPTVALTAPADGAHVKGLVSLAATASDNLGVVKVDFLVDGVVVATDTTEPYGAGWDSTTHAAGPASISARATDTTGNEAVSALVGVQVDNVVPDTTISSGPTGTLAVATATFEFSSTEPTATFECSLDFVGYTACTSPQAYNAMPDGVHTFQVRAVDLSNNIDATPALRTWTIDTTAPETVITAGPTGTVSSDAYSISFGTAVVEANVTFECRLDGAAFAACTSPATGSALADGAHTFEVRALDSLGNTDATPAVRTWTIDTTPVDTTITSKPADLENVDSATFRFTGAESGTTFECRLDGAAFAPCVAPATYNALADGSHTFEVRGTDSLGNVDPTPASFTWTIDTAAPDTTITSAPPAMTGNKDATFTFASTEAGSTFKCSRDGAPFSGCPSPQTYLNLPVGTHTVEVVAVDAAANADATPASHTWVIDGVGPSVSSTTPQAGATNVSVTGQVTAVFSEPMDATTLTTTTFTLVASGAVTPVAATVTYDELTQTATFVPSAPLAYLTTYEATVSGAATDTSGLPLGVSTVWSFTTAADLVAPETTITSAPPAFSGAAASFAFGSSEAGSTFMCRLDAAAFAACTSPRSYTGLAVGTHTFEVRAHDAFGNVDPTPAAHTWVVDTTAPTVQSTSPTHNSTDVLITANVTAVFSELIDESTLTTSTFTLVRRTTTTVLPATVTFDAATRTATLNPTSNLLNNTRYIATIRGGASGVKDRAGQPLPADVVINFTTIVLDTSPPTVSLTAPAAGAQVTGNVTLSASASDNLAMSRVEFLVDGVVVGTDLTSPYSMSWNSTTHIDGAAVIAARAFDTTGNATTSATRTVTVDNTAPDTSITAGPTGTVTTTTATFSFVAVGTASSFQCSLDGGAYASCTSPRTYTNLSSASHTFNVRAVDAVGNADATPASRSWTVDASAPDTTITAGPSGASNSTAASFSFTATEAGATFACALDGAPFTSCVSPQNYSGLTVASHTFQVRATDAVGNVDATPASRTWTVDLTAPTVTSVVPSSGATGVALTVRVDAVFSEGMDATTLTSNFTLVQQATGTAVAGAVTYDAATRTASLQPSSALLAGTAYTATVRGGASGAKDAAGNALAVDRVWSFTTGTPPAAPTGLVALAVSSSQVTLTWSDASNNETRFRIERSTNGTTFTEIATVGANVTTFQNTGLSKSTTYWYRVRAYNGAGMSAYTNTDSTRTPNR